MAASWGLQPVTIDGVVRQVQIDPYNDNPLAGGSHTQAMCLTLSTTAGLVDGEILGIWGAQNNWELEAITHVVDGTHIIIPLDHPHDVGELVTAGAGVGWGLGTPANDYPTGFLGDRSSNNYTTQHAAYPVMRINNGAVELYTNSAATNGVAEVHLNLYTSLVPQAPLTFNPVVSNGVITALNPTSVGTGNAPFGSYNTTAGNTLDGFFHILPPPTVTVTGCTTAPVINFVAAAEFSYSTILVSGGSGCVNPTVTATTTATNPVVFYPLTRTVHVEDPNASCPVRYSTVANCPSDGYLRTNQLTADWAVGDHVEQSPWWNQYLRDQQNFSGSIDQERSGTYSAIHSKSYRFQEGGTPSAYYKNETPSSMYFGRAANNYQRVTTTDPTQIMDATVATPTWTELSPNWQTALTIDSPPTVGQGRNGTGGAMFKVQCSSVNGFSDDMPCARGVVSDFDLFLVDLHNVPGIGAVAHFGYSLVNNCFTINGVCLNPNAGSSGSTGSAIPSNVTGLVYSSGGTPRQAVASDLASAGIPVDVASFNALLTKIDPNCGTAGYGGYNPGTSKCAATGGTTSTDMVAAPTISPSNATIYLSASSATTVNYITPLPGWSAPGCTTACVDGTYTVIFLDTNSSLAATTATAGATPTSTTGNIASSFRPASANVPYTLHYRAKTGILY